jgi:hypothetical protein
VSVAEAALSILDGDPALADLLAAATPGDRSVLWGALDYENSGLMTSDGSNNHRLWQRLADHGLMTATAPPEGLPIVARQFELTERGRRMVPVLLHHAWARAAG